MKTVVVCGVAIFVLATASRAADMRTFGPGEINFDYRDNVAGADRKYNKWFLLSGVVQSIRTDAWQITWVEIRDPDDKVAMDYVAAQVRSDQRETIAKYRRWDEILLVCHGTHGDRSAGNSSIVLVNNCSLAKPPQS